MSTTTSKKEARLIFVAPGGTRGNNKFYNMVDNGDGTFTAKYGRVGGHETPQIYPMDEWDSKLREKERKGYKNVTEHFLVEDNSGVTKNTKLATDFYSNRPKAVIEITKRLQEYANISIKANYTVAAEKVTQKQVDAAQEVLNRIAALPRTSKGKVDFKATPISKINDSLLELYHIIPRRMEVVDKFVLHANVSQKESEDKFEEILQKEQDTLDVMAGQVKTMAGTTDTTKDANNDGVVDIIEAAGLEIVEITQKEIDIIKSNMQNRDGMFKRAFKVINKQTQKAFDSHLKKADNKTTKLLWHGSRTENWWSIMTKGLLIRPSSAAYTGSMFGDGIYAAREFDKSLGYTSIFTSEINTSSHHLTVRCPLAN